MVVGCGSRVAPTSSQAGETVASDASAASAAAAQTCNADGDCRTSSSYCLEAPCACRVLGKADAVPACAGGTVTCFVDPCMSKTAACQSGRCVLVPASK